MKSLYLSMLLFFAALVGVACAQTPNPTPPASLRQPSTQSPDSQSVPVATTPAEMQTLVKALSGKWSLKVKFEPNDHMPAGSEGHGEEWWHAGPGGFTLLEEEQLQTPAQNLLLLGVVWWDGKTREFHGMECNDQNPHACDVKASLNDISIHWDGKQFVIEEQETSPTGKKSLWHEVFSDITPTSFLQTGDSAEAGGPMKRLLTIHATRITDQARKSTN